MNRTLVWMAVAAILGFGGYTISKHEFEMMRTVEPKTLLVASYRCMNNGDLPADRNDPYSGLRNMRTMTRTGIEAYTIVCVNGAHFFDTIRLVSNASDSAKSALPAPDIGLGKPEGKPTTDSITRRPAS